MSSLLEMKNLDDIHKKINGLKMKTPSVTKGINKISHWKLKNLQGG